MTARINALDHPRPLHFQLPPCSVVLNFSPLTLDRWTAVRRQRVRWTNGCRLVQACFRWLLISRDIISQEASGQTAGHQPRMAMSDPPYHSRVARCTNIRLIPSLALIYLYSPSFLSPLHSFRGGHSDPFVLCLRDFYSISP